MLAHGRRLSPADFARFGPGANRSCLCHCKNEHRPKIGSFRILDRAGIRGISSRRASASWCPPADRTSRKSTSTDIRSDKSSRSCRLVRLRHLRERGPFDRGRRLEQGRSEEHTSELQSLMRISYAVFCLKKKKQT